MKKRLIFLSVALAAATACHVDVMTDADGLYSDHLYAALEQFPRGRAELSEDNDILWCSGDRISVFDFTDRNEEYMLEEACDGTQEGEFSYVQGKDSGNSSSPLDHFVAFYPYSSSLECRDSRTGYTIRGFELPAVQTWREDTFDYETFPMVAVSDRSDSFSFKNVSGILKISIKGTGKVKSLTLVGNDQETLAGDAIVYAYSSSKNPYLVFTGQTYSQLTLECGSGVQLDPEKPVAFMFALPPTDFSSGFKVDVECVDKGIVTVSTSKENCIHRSMILKMPVFDLDALNGEDDEVIVFEDPVVEKVFVSKYDQNDDRVVSLKEAAAVKTIEDFFFGNDAEKVESLNDLRHFTSLTDIGDDAFRGCSFVESVTMPESLRKIGKRAFADCSTLSVVNLNEGLASVCEEAFASCYNLIEMYFPDSLISMDEDVFKDCINLESFSGAGVAADGRSLVFGGVLVAYASSGATKFEYKVPSNVRRIGKSAFYNCRNIVGVITHDTLESIGDEAFFGCGLLENVSLAEGLQEIGSKSFARCYSLKSLFLPSTLLFIGEKALAERIGIKELHVSSLMPPRIDKSLFDIVPDEIAIYVPDESLSLYLASDGWKELHYFIQGENGGGETSSLDGIVKQLQRAKEGKGINIVMMGDAFSESDIESKLYDSYMRKACDAFFSVEPYSSFRDYFNVYSVNVVSSHSGYDLGTGKLKTYFGEGTFVGGNTEIVSGYAKKALKEEDMDDALVFVIMNRKYYAGTCHMFYPSDGDYGRGLAIAYFPLGTDDRMFETLIHHEAGGHGFAKLEDEYSYPGRISADEISDIRSLENFGWAKNADFTPDWNKVKWKVFLYDERYASENLGVYEGACTYTYGAYRPSVTSIMNNNVGGYNAPSRQAIWYRIHKLAYGKSWRYDHEDFVEYDAVNLRTRSSSTMKVQGCMEELPPLHSPVIIRQSWREMMDK